MCVCLCQTQGNSIGSASRVSNTRSAQWGIHWEQWCWQWMGIMDLSDKLTNCPTSDLTSQSREIAVFSGVFWDVCCTIYKEQSEWRTDFPEWCFRCCWEEGRADRQTSLSLINKPQQWSGGMPFDLINKRDTAYAFPHKLSSGLSEEMARRVTDTVAWMEDVQQSWDSPTQVLENLPLSSSQSPLLRGTIQKYLLVVKCFVLQDFLWKGPHVELAQLKRIWIVLNINAKNAVYTTPVYTNKPLFQRIRPWNTTDHDIWPHRKQFYLIITNSPESHNLNALTWWLLTAACSLCLQIKNRKANTVSPSWMWKPNSWSWTPTRRFCSAAGECQVDRFGC